MPWGRRSRSATRTPAGSRRSARASTASRWARPSPCTARGVAGVASAAAGAWRTTASGRPRSAPLGGGLGLDGGMAQLHAGPRGPAPGAPRRPRPRRGRAADRRRADPVPRGQALAAAARGRLDRGRHRRRRPGPHGAADPGRRLPRHRHRRRPAARRTRPGQAGRGPPCRGRRARRGGRGARPDGGQGADVVLDLVGVDATLALAAASPARWAT